MSCSHTVWFALRIWGTDPAPTPRTQQGLADGMDLPGRPSVSSHPFHRGPGRHRQGSPRQTQQIKDPTPVPHHSTSSPQDQALAACDPCRTKPPPSPAEAAWGLSLRGRGRSWWRCSLPRFGGPGARGWHVHAASHGQGEAGGRGRACSPPEAAYHAVLTRTGGRNMCAMHGSMGRLKMRVRSPDDWGKLCRWHRQRSEGHADLRRSPRGEARPLPSCWGGSHCLCSRTPAFPIGHAPPQQEPHLLGGLPGGDREAVGKLRQGHHGAVRGSGRTLVPVPPNLTPAPSPPRSTGRAPPAAGRTGQEEAGGAGGAAGKPGGSPSRGSAPAALGRSGPWQGGG